MHAIRLATCLSILTLTGCQWGSGNVNTGPVYITKVFVGCPNASSGLASQSEGSTTGGVGLAADVPTQSGDLKLDSAAVFVGGLAAHDTCSAHAEIETEPVPDEATMSNNP